MNIRILTAEDVRRALPMREAVEGMKQAYAQLSSGKADVPLRGRVAIAPHEATTLTMPAYLQESEALAVKIVSVFPHNSQRQEPVIYGAVLVLDAQSGRPLALLNGGTLTAIRTGAGAGAATDVLARDDAKIAAIIGSGVQARTQLEAVCAVRTIVEVRVFSPNQEHATAFAAEMRGQGAIPAVVQVVDAVETAVRGADIICAATTSSTPVFSGEDVAPGTHINGVGSYTAKMQEVDVDTIRKALVVVDNVEAVLDEAGDLIIPIQQGQFSKAQIAAELGEIIAGSKPGRLDVNQITFFKSVGNAAQDAIAAQIVLRNAEKLGLGTMVEL